MGSMGLMGLKHLRWASELLRGPADQPEGSHGYEAIKGAQGGTKRGRCALRWAAASLHGHHPGQRDPSCWVTGRGLHSHVRTPRAQGKAVSCFRAKRCFTRLRAATYEKTVA